MVRFLTAGCIVSAALISAGCARNPIPPITRADLAASDHRALIAKSVLRTDFVRPSLISGAIKYAGILGPLSTKPWYSAKPISYYCVRARPDNAVADALGAFNVATVIISAPDEAFRVTVNRGAIYDCPDIYQPFPELEQLAQAG